MVLGLQIALIVIGFVLLLGPLMWVFAKLNKIDPFILDRFDAPKDDMSKEELRSFMLVSILRPLFAPLFLEKKIINLFKKNK